MPEWLIFARSSFSWLCPSGDASVPGGDRRSSPRFPSHGDSSQSIGGPARPDRLAPCNRRDATGPVSRSNTIPARGARRVHTCNRGCRRSGSAPSKTRGGLRRAEAGLWLGPHVDCARRGQRVWPGVLFQPFGCKNHTRKRQKSKCESHKCESHTYLIELLGARLGVGSSWFCRLKYDGGMGRGGGRDVCAWFGTDPSAIRSARDPIKSSSPRVYRTI